MKSNERVVERAKLLGSAFHIGQLDKIGNDYFDAHVEPVADMVRSWDGSEDQIAAAYLHDTIEDGYTTTEGLEAYFPADIVKIVEVLTKPPNINYQGYISQLITHEPAVLVKIADITSNMDPARLFYIEPDTRNRLVDKYTKALPVLWRAYNGR